MNNLFMLIDASALLDFKVLTKHRVPGAIPIFSKYRMIDFPLSMAKKSGIVNVGIVIDKNYRSLQDHIGSGTRYNLDRRRDGIFILPPKNLNPIEDEFMSLSRLFEHIEYFNRSNQEYAVIVPSTLISMIDFNEILEYHIEKNKEITQIVSNTGERLYSFIISKKRLVDYILEYNELTLRNITEIYDSIDEDRKSTYIYPYFSKYISNITEYYNIQKEFLKNPFLYGILKDVRTKEPIDSATFIDENAEVKNSLIACGSMIDGKVYNSFLSRKVVIGDGSIIENSIIMNNVKIGKGAVIKNSILDKETIVMDGAIIEGSELNPFLSEKSQKLYNSSIKDIVFLTAECTPFIKRGGLADVVGGLSRELSNLGVNVKVFIPLYKEIKVKSYTKSKEFTLMVEDKEYHLNAYIQENGNLSYYFLDLYMFFNRDKIYDKDDYLRFTYFVKGVIEYLDQSNQHVDIFHIHDWHMCTLPLMIKKYPRYENVKSVLTIHNLNYQGETPVEILDKFDLKYDVKSKNIKLLELGINTVSEIVTVSKTYASELKYQYYSGDLRDSILRRWSNLYGIVNGLDSKISPEKDLEIKANYNINTVFDKKVINKKYLAEISGFEYSSDMFIMGIVSRINSDKGFDIIIDALYELLKNPKMYFVLLGVGDEYYMERLKELNNTYKNNVKLFLDYNGTNPSYIYSGADIFLMPSRIEPCGTSQMIALKYGTIPIVRQTGGLNDTITQFDSFNDTGNGFKFYNFDSRDLISTVYQAYNLFLNPESFKKIIINAMSSNYSMEDCAKEYLNIYNIEKK